MNENNNLERDIEIEIIKSIINNKVLLDVGFEPHSENNRIIFIDNINGKFDCAAIPMHRETGEGYFNNNWCRSRAIVYALLNSLNLFPILALLPKEAKQIVGMGVSDDERYARVLENVFTYFNTFYHKDPQLDLMVSQKKYNNTFDFIICSDVLEHIIGDWRVAAKNMYDYLKPGGVLILTVPMKRELLKTVEHYPDSIGYDVIFDGNNYHSTIIKWSDRKELAVNPIFHGGPGNTLEMRIFSFNDLKNELNLCGFKKQNYFELNQPLYGIIPNDKFEGVLALFKGID